MKVAELRKKLAPLKKEELIKLAVEFYKLVPKAKKEDYQLDEMVNNPSKPKPKKTTASTTLPLSEIERLVNKFEEDAKEQNYLYRNRSVPKKERSTWRFKVKKWYQELVNVQRKDANLTLQAELLGKLYGLLTAGGYHNYFTSDMPFKSVGVSQPDFYKSILVVWQAAAGKLMAIEKGIPIMTSHVIDEETSIVDLIVEFISCLPIPDLKESAIEKVEAEIKTLNFVPKPQKSTKMGGFTYYFDNRTPKEKERESKHIAFVLLNFQLYIALFEYDEAIAFYKTHLHENDEETKVFKLISLLFSEGLKGEIKNELEIAIKNGIALRANLVKMLKFINKYGALPDNFYFFDV